MAIRAEHELHGRRRSRNVGVGVTLMLFVGIVFGLTIVKLLNGGSIEGFDHSVRPAMTVEE